MMSQLPSSLSFRKGIHSITFWGSLSSHICHKFYTILIFCMSSIIVLFTFICLLISSFLMCSTLDFPADLCYKSISVASIYLAFLFFCGCQTSEPYISTGFNTVLQILSFVSVLIFFCHSIKFNIRITFFLCSILSSMLSSLCLVVSL